MKLIIISTKYFMANIPIVIAHGSGLGGYGCHYNRKQGGYQCHRGENKGKHYASKDEMLKSLKSKG